MATEQEPLNTFSCKYCNKKFSIASNRNRHVKRLHEKKELSKGVSCPHCEYRCRDKYQLRVHIRSHTKEKPFPCTRCSFRATKMEDCRRHMLACKGPRYQCPNCKGTFKSKVSMNKHYIWDKTCGTLADREGGQEDNVVRIDLGQEVSVVGVNCQELLSQEVFEKRLKRRRCGLCYSCQADKDCGDCRVCLEVERGGKTCIRRACYQPLDLYRVREQQGESQPIMVMSDVVLGEEIGDTLITCDGALEGEDNCQKLLTEVDLAPHEGIGSSLVVGDLAVDAVTAKDFMLDSVESDGTDLSQVILMNENVIHVSGHQDIICDSEFQVMNGSS